MRLSTLLLFLIIAYLSPCTYAQGTAADYERAGALRAKYEAAVIDIAGAPTWIGNTHRFWYRKLSRGTGRGDRYAAYGDHKRYDFFVRNLLGLNPPAWNQVAATGERNHRDEAAH